MAFTKAPTQNNHNVIRLPALGTSIAVTEVGTTAAQPETLSYLDCFPRTEKQWGKDPIRRIHKRDGWERGTMSGTSSTSPVCGKSIVLAESVDNAFVARGTDILKITGLNTPGAMTVAVEQSGVTGAQFASGTLAINNSNVNKVCFLDLNANLYTWSEDGSNNTTTSSLPVNGYRGLVFLNGYLFAASSAGRIYNSNPGGVLTTWGSTDWLSAEMYPDFIEYLDIHRNHLVAFGKNSIEFFYDAAIEIGSPLARNETYASRIGIVHTDRPGAVTAKINDDIYFIGRTSNNVRSLYRIHNFQVEEIYNEYMSRLLNWVGSASNYQQVNGIETCIINGRAVIIISTGWGLETVYDPTEDSWWNIRTNNDTAKGAASNVNTDFPAWNYRLGWALVPTSNSLNQPTILGIDTSATTAVYAFSPAYATRPTVQADLYTEVVDLGVNREKHFARIDAIGDYGNNTLTLSYNGTPNYSQTYTACSPTRNMATSGYGNSPSWYNLGAYRRASFKFTMSGTDFAFHEGFDIEYNIGVW